MPQVAKLTFSVEFTVIRCGACDIDFAVTTSWYEQRVRDHQEWRCPNGCVRVFGGETPEQRLERQKQELQAKLNAESHARLVAEKHAQDAAAETARLKARIAHGVCPCCGRTFSNLSRHMNTKHPNELPAGSHRQIGQSSIQ